PLHALHSFPTRRSSDLRLEEAESHGARVAVAPAYRPQPRRARQDDQPGRPWMDALLRGLLPVGAVHPPGAYQHLPGAVDPEEVQAVTGPEESSGVLGASHQAVSQLLRPLGVGQESPDDQDGRSGVTGDCHAPFWGSPGVTPPGHPTLGAVYSSSMRSSTVSSP